MSKYKELFKEAGLLLKAGDTENGEWLIGQAAAARFFEVTQRIIWLAEAGRLKPTTVDIRLHGLHGSLSWDTSARVDEHMQRAEFNFSNQGFTELVSRSITQYFPGEGAKPPHIRYVFRPKEVSTLEAA